MTAVPDTGHNTAPADASSGPVRLIRVPAIGGHVLEAELRGWTKSLGDAVVAGEVLFEVETDKAVIAAVAVCAGRLIGRSVTHGLVCINQAIGELELARDDLPATAGVVVGTYEP